MEDGVRESTADKEPLGKRPRWMGGEHLQEQLKDRSADPGLSAELDQLVGSTLHENV